METYRLHLDSEPPKHQQDHTYQKEARRVKGITELSDDALAWIWGGEVSHDLNVAALNNIGVLAGNGALGEV